TDSENHNNEIDQKDLRIAELEKETAELRDRFLRKVAEFENYKRRNENDQLNLLKYSAASFLTRLLPVIDDFERSLEHIEDAKDINAIKEGLKLIYGKLKKALDDEGVQKIEAVGKPFDVNFHEAIMQRPDNSVEPHTVLDEIEKGYMYKDKVIRHSKVIVSEESSEETIEKNDKNSNTEN
ncbi:MAG: nucleotide exchange factor GrpE, partial [Ignavibacteriales bacterium]